MTPGSTWLSELGPRGRLFPGRSGPRPTLLWRCCLPVNRLSERQSVQPIFLAWLTRACGRTVRATRRHVPAVLTTRIVGGTPFALRSSPLRPARTNATLHFIHHFSVNSISPRIRVKSTSESSDDGPVRVSPTSNVSLALLVAAAMTHARATDTLAVFVDQATINQDARQRVDAGDRQRAHRRPQRAAGRAPGRHRQGLRHDQPDRARPLRRSARRTQHPGARCAGSSSTSIAAPTARPSAAAPDCAPRITLCDSPAFFDKTLAQTSNRNARAQGQPAVAGAAR